MYTKHEALLASYTLLDDIHDEQKKKGNNTLLRLISDMNPFIWSDLTTGDSSLWSDRIKCATSVKENDELSSQESFDILVSFLKYEKKTYNFDDESNYDVEKLINEMKAPQYQDRWVQLLERAKAYLTSRRKAQTF
ncbi:MAG: hypothetical protein LBI13_02670 [Streptococcaceae bacterium]|jgi:hypothetical protein|nr:hypothetical protein [Streptococcaceae bacterium]